MTHPADSDLPVLAVDVDGVVSLFGWEGPPQNAPCEFHLFDGMAHCIAFDVGDRLRRLADYFDLAWATGWEDRANDHLPHLLGIGQLPVIRFGRYAKFGSAHWKLEPIANYAFGRPLAWIDDNIDDQCREWASNRTEPTMLIHTDPTRGLEEPDVGRLIAWAKRIDPGLRG